VPGRIRIKFTNGFIRHALVQELIGKLGILNGNGESAFNADGVLRDTSPLPGVKSARLNLLGRSIIVEYDPTRWQPQWVDELLSTRETKRVQNILDSMAGELDNKNIEPFTQEKNYE
jgi:hypothetical protein